MSAPPRIRRDPRDTAAARVRPAARAPEAPAEASPTRIDAPACHVLVVADIAGGWLTPSDREAIGAARQLADLLGGALVLFAGSARAEGLRLRPDLEGADRVILSVDPLFAQELAEPRVALVLTALAACAARHAVFPETPLGGELARRVAARLGERPAAAVQRLSATEVTLTVDGGRDDMRRPLPRLLLPRPAPWRTLADAGLREARPIPIEATAPPLLAHIGRNLPVDPATVPLAEAALILSAGAGVTDWEAFHRAAAALGAAEAGSRVVCDAGHLPRDRQVGVSGAIVAPRGYLAFGIAGASQHLHGIAAAERVVAVNADPGAEIMQRADLAIVGDAQAVLPALARRAVERLGAGDVA